MGSVATNEIGKASGTLNMLFQLGGVFGVAILVVVFTASGSYNSAQTFNAGLVPAIEISAALSLVGAVAGIGLPRRKVALMQEKVKA
jgi:hypothetical protein